MDRWKSGGMIRQAALFPAPPSVSPTHCDSSQQPLRHIGYHNGHKEDHGPKEGVADTHGHHKECGTEEDGQARNDVHKMFNLDCNRSLLIFHTRGQRCYAPNDGPVTGAHHQALRCACHGEESSGWGGQHQGSALWWEGMWHASEKTERGCYGKCGGCVASGQGSNASQTLQTHGGEEGDVAGLQGTLMCAVR